LLELQVDVAFLHNATNSLRGQAQSALKNQTQDALNETLERFQEDIIRMLQKQVSARTNMYYTQPERIVLKIWYVVIAVCSN
jgi:hypothetical protein